MIPSKPIIQRILLQTILIFALSFLWNLITGDSFQIAVKEAFLVFLIALVGISIIETAFRFYQK